MREAQEVFSLAFFSLQTDKAGTLNWSECEHQQHHSRWLFQEPK